MENERDAITNLGQISLQQVFMIHMDTCRKISI